MGMAAICTVTGALLKAPPRRADVIFPALCNFWPPRSLTLVAFKQERRLEAWADGRLLKSYPILAASGGPGIKRREGDLQVPEGIYRLTTLNPQSRFHLSVRVDYPDAEDRAQGCTGSDIYVHGGAASIGCIAIGNPGIEEVYRLAQLVDDRRILILPWDFSRRTPPETAEPWVAERYERLERELEALRHVESPASNVQSRPKS
jgi:hypothetical protein